MIKEKLLNTDEFEDNPFLDKYISLIEENRNTEYKKGEHNSHHIIPRYVFNMRCEEVDNSKNNKVNLLFKDHMLAHYYLSGCAKGQGKYWNLYAIYRLSGRKECQPEYVNFIENLDEFQKIYEEAVKIPNHRKGSKVSDITKEKMSIAALKRNEKYGIHNKDRVWINNGQLEKMIDKNELEVFIQKGFLQGRLYKHSEETKKKLVHYGPRGDAFKEKMRLISKNRTPHSPESFAKISESLKKYYETHDNPFKGKKHSEATKELNRQKHLGKIAVNNGITSTMIDKENLDFYIAQGWKRGYGNTRKTIK